MAREARWSGLGIDVSRSSNLEEVLHNSKLDYEVIKRPLYTTFNENGKQRTVRFNNNMVATVNGSTGEPLGLVSKNYEIIQNRDAFSFVDSMGDALKFEKAGMTESGMVYIIARLADREILGDKYQPFVILQNSFNGAYSLKAAICPLRIVCQNQFRLAFKESENTVLIRHSGNIVGKMENARKILVASDEYLKTMDAMAEKLATIRVSEQAKDDIIQLMYPIREDMNVRSIHRIEDKRAEFLNAYNMDDNGNFRGTLYGFVNAASDIDTHSEPSRKKDNWQEKQFMWSIDSDGFYVPKVIDAATKLGLLAA